MANKAAVQATINAIATGTANTALEVRTMGNDLLAQVFPAPVRENSTGTHANTSVNGSALPYGLIYDLVFAKSGNQVFVTGTITNQTSGTAPGGISLININTAEYHARTSFDSIFRADNVSLKIIADRINLITSLGSYQTVRLNLTYLTND